MSLPRRAPLRPPTGRCSRGRGLSNFSGRARAHRTPRRSRPLRLRGAAGEGVGAPPPAADPWGIRPPGMGGEPHSVPFDLWPAPPRPGSQVVYTETMRPPVLSTGAPPEWQGAGTPGFDRAASGAVDLPFSHREANAAGSGPRTRCPAQRSRPEPAAPTPSAGPTRGRPTCSPTPTCSTPSSSRPPRAGAASTGTRLKCWSAFSIFPLPHRDAPERLSTGELPAPRDRSRDRRMSRQYDEQARAIRKSQAMS